MERREVDKSTASSISVLTAHWCTALFVLEQVFCAEKLDFFFEQSRIFAAYEEDKSIMYGVVLGTRSVGWVY